MWSTIPVQEDFYRRLQTIPRLGLGLSVDVYSPDLFELMTELECHGFRPAYLELFKASTAALVAVRRRFPELPLTYHGEGLWVTQPDFSTGSFLDNDLDEAVRHLRTLASCWLNHECATKQMAGYSFGTYLPPLYTGLSAAVVADNVTFVQRKLDERYGDVPGPLFLLEMAPLTYFSAGTMKIPDFFRLITERAPCGLVLDIGHLWTLYRYTVDRHEHSLERFVGGFLDTFPLERVVEIHIAGLARHGTGPAETVDTRPAWIDSHAAPIPSVLWDMLEQVMAHPGLCNLRAVGLEVDTKPIPLILEEFGSTSLRFAEIIRRKLAENRRLPDATPSLNGERAEAGKLRETDLQKLAEGYADYARVVSGQVSPTGLEWQAVSRDDSGLSRYIHEYLPHEILSWGGSLVEMFPDTCRALRGRGPVLDGFVSWWFKSPRPCDRSYDFFLLKIERFLEFVAEIAPDLSDVAEREARILRSAYAEANEHVEMTHVSGVER